ncbi:hypothetical protein IIO_00323 [Bacillus cereus VD115]|nr:hypothetical protein IIO_00323 [Bacillus cereus VD115]
MKRALFFFISIFFLGSCSISDVTFLARAKVGRGNIKGILRMTVKMEYLRFSIRVEMEIQNLKIWRFLFMGPLVQ